MDEVTRRAFETLERLDAADQQREQQRAAQRALGYDDSAPYEEPIDMTWDPANPPGLTVATMNQREFSAWVDAGRPPLEKPKPQPEQRPVETVKTITPEEQRPWDEWLLAHLCTVCEAVGAESGAYVRELRDDMKREIAALQAPGHEAGATWAHQ